MPINGKIFIAEIKTMSPFGFKSNYSPNFLKQLAIKYGDWIGVHTDPLWGGSFVDIVNIKNTITRMSEPSCTNPILAKVIHSSDYHIRMALEYGADYVTVVGRIPKKEYLPKCLLEPLNLKQLQEFIKLEEIYGIILNQRNLFDGFTNKYLGSWIDVIPNIIKNIKVIQASSIKRPKEVHNWADGFIVGEHLPQFILAKELGELANA